MKFISGFLVALVGSIVANLIILYAFRPFAIDPAMPLHALSIGPVVALTAIGIVGATIVYALMRELMTRPNTPFIIVSVVVLVLSFIPDLMIIGQTTGPFAGGNLSSAIVLMCMHVAAALITVWALVQLWGAKAPKVVSAQ